MRASEIDEYGVSSISSEARKPLHLSAFTTFVHRIQGAVPSKGLFLDLDCTRLLG